MKRFLTVFTILITCFGLMATSAEARRLGGGGTFGKQRNVSPQQAPQRAPAAAPAPAPGQNAAANSNRNKWLGPLAGLAIGAGLASMLGGAGLGGAMGSILLAILAAVALMFIASRFMKPKQPDMRYAGTPPPYDANTPFARESNLRDIPAASGSASYGQYDALPAVGQIPADFPLESFLRGAKASFIRLQAANDRKDLDDIREYTTPEMFAEISMQLMERGDSLQTTDVLNLHAELLEAVTEANLAIATVRYTGQLVENKGAPEYIDELWVVQRNALDPKSGWLLAGIQQTQLQ